MSLRRLLSALVLCLTAALCLTSLAEVDAFWHLLAGREILASGHVPRVDQFTYTSAGRPWVDLHWLFQVLLAEVHRLGGFAALDLLKTTLIVAAFAVALLAAGRRRPTLAAPVLALPGVIAAQERFTLRPEAVSFLLLAIVLWILEDRRRAPRRLAILPPLLALWANLHALYAMGLAVVFLVLLGDLFDAWRRRRNGPGATLGRTPEETASLRSLRWLGGAAGLSVPATLLTPYGFGAWELPRTLLLERVVAGNLFGGNIAEFQPPFGGFGATASVFGFAILIALVVPLAIAGRRAATSADRLLLGAFFILALLARRNMPLFALVALGAATPAVAETWSRIAQRLAGVAGGPSGAVTWGRRAVGTLACLSALGLLGEVISNRFFARDGTQRSFGTGVAPGLFPETAAGVVEAQALAGEVFHDLSDGGYLAWRWWPRRRTYIDGRLEVHAADLFATYLRVQQDPQRFEAEARARDIRIVVWSHAHALDAVPLLQHLATSRDWRLVHVDLAAAVFARPDASGAGGELQGLDLDAAPPTARLLAEAETVAARTAAQDPLPALVRRLVPRRQMPVGEVGAGLFFALIGRHQVALDLLADAARRAPWSAALRYDLGLVLTQAAREPEALARFEEALLIDPSLVAARAAAALLQLRAGNEAQALSLWERAERDAALPPAARQARGALHARRGRLDEAIADYRAALRAEPGRAEWRSELALLLSARGLPDQAEAEIRRALAEAPHACAPYLAAARLRHAAGDRDAALEAARAGLRADPGCQEARLEAARLLLEANRRDEAAALVAEAMARGLDRSILAGDPLLQGLAPLP